MIENWNSGIGKNFRKKRESHHQDHESDHVDLETHFDHVTEEDDHEANHEYDHKNTQGNNLIEHGHDDHDHDYDQDHDHDYKHDDLDDQDHAHKNDQVWTSAQAYGYATLANGIITLTSLSGILFISCVQERLKFCSEIFDN